MIYLIGSLRNPEVPKIANRLREELQEAIFDDWYAAGPTADDCWRDYEKARGHSFPEALQGYAAKNVYRFDRTHLDGCRAAVLLLPAGKSGHLELGYVIGTGRPGYILLDEDPERFDVMYQFANGVFNTIEELINGLQSSADLVRQERHTHCRICGGSIVLDSSGHATDYQRDCGHCRGDRALTWAEEELLRRLDG